MINKIYKILLAHNRSWTFKELILFFIMLGLSIVIFFILLKKDKIIFFQLIAGELLFLFIFIVLGSTVFTRVPDKVKAYKLMPFWSWNEVIKGDIELLEENLLNLILLFPFGFLLPFVFYRKIRWYKALIMGLAFSFFIETSQLILKRGFFEWDDMIHNSLGAMLGCIIANKIFEKFVKKD
ncbi:VanZ family protein [uncultured Fusobacterium sp.]|uniref:VanZ family protein n=1 Tax=uncultured Fusobacterium sp. TaxID=159267 RepID=UPI00265ED878|nr:VanZ family protein [uncultured Fusobacterium sp.]